MSTLSEIRADVQANWPSNYHSSSLTNAKTDEFINRVQRRICRLYNYTWMKQRVTRDTANDTRDYTLPTAGDTDWTDAAAGTVRKFKSDLTCELINSESYRIPLTKRFKKDIEDDTNFRSTTASGTPSDYCIAEDKLKLYKLPDNTANSGSDWSIDFEFYGYLADLSGDSATNKITADYPEALECGATALGYRFGMDIEMAEYYENKAEEIIAEMIRTDQIQEYGQIERGMKPEDGQELGSG